LTTRQEAILILQMDSETLAAQAGRPVLVDLRIEEGMENVGPAFPRVDEDIVDSREHRAAAVDGRQTHRTGVSRARDVHEDTTRTEPHG
jgi:hypothetical protein